MAVMTNSQPVVGGNGDIYTAPVGTPIPTDIEAPAAPWVKLGMVSEDGVSWTPPEEDTDEIKIWQSAYPARVITTGLTSSMSFALDGWDRNTVPFAMGGGTFTDVGTDTVVFSPPQAGSSTSRAIFVKVLDGDTAAGGIVMGLYFAKGRVTGRDDTVFNASEPALLNVEFSLEALVNPDGSVEDPYNLVFDDASFPPVAVTATGATEVSGAAGTWTPTGATPRPNFAGMVGITASPTTAWSTDSHMVLGDNAHTHWTGSAWATGDAS
jgi:hypothetical protein